MKYFGVLLLIVTFTIVGTRAFGQTDNFGAVDNVYIDSLKAYPGQAIALTVNLRNDELLSAVSVPLVYDPSVLTLTAISFSGSRCEYIQSKLISPASIPSINGHFAVMVLRLQEAALAVGDGMIFTLQFTVSADAVPGDVLLIDSLYLAPVGEMLLTEASQSASIRPAFKAGKVVVIPTNRAPQFATIANPTVVEGDSLKVAVQVTDPDLDNITLTCIAKPTGAVFSAGVNGSGLLTWVPEYVGLSSAAGSPFKLTFRATDGNLTVDKDVQVTVTNKNRNPVLTAPTTQAVTAGQTLSFTISMYEPDFETVTWQMVGQPVGSTLVPGNPASFGWTSAITDSGTKTVDFIVTDPEGLADTARVQIQVAAATLYTLSIDTELVDPGQAVTLTISLQNELPVSAFDLLINYDPAALTLLGASKSGTLTDYFAMYTVTDNDGSRPGHLRIVGRAATSGVGTPIATGSGAVTKLTFRTSGSVAYSGMAIPVRFVFLDAPVNADNTLTDGSGTRIPQTSIAYTNGLVQIKSIGVIRIGDINLNGLAYEISDAVYFTNFFLNPAGYPFDALQYANSDVNQDGYAATVADLVRLITTIVGTSGAAKPETDSTLSAELRCVGEGGEVLIGYDAPFAVGGIYFEFAGSTAEIHPLAASANMAVEAREEGGVTRVLVYSMDGQSMPEGDQAVMSIAGLSRLEISRAEMSDADGRLARVTLNTGHSLPEAFALEQNYPNPFNPETRIGFSLPQSGWVTLTVYDVLGRTVRTLADGNLAAGQHEAAWDGRDSRGEAVGSGVYLYRLETPDGSYARKMMLLK